MRLQFPFRRIVPASTTAERPGTAETVLRWQEVGGVEGVPLEWMLDRMRPAQEA